MSQEEKYINFLTKFKTEFQTFYSDPNNQQIEKIFQKLKNKINSTNSLENYERQFFISFLKEVISMVKKEELNHRDFIFEELKKNKIWIPLVKIILLKRIEELKNCQVEKKGKKYYIQELKRTYFGEFIMEKLDFSRKSVLNQEEYEKIISAIKKLNYELPIVVQPTETESFFKK